MTAAERITAPLVKKVFDEHLQRHELKLDKVENYSAAELILMAQVFS